MGNKSNFFTEEINPNTNFIVTMLTLIALLFQKSLLFIFIQVMLFIILNLLKNGKIRLMPSVIIIISISFFSLIYPIGKVLFRIGHFPITLTALIIGLKKGLILSGMVFISKFALGKNLKFPGRLGILVGRSFEYLNQFTAHKINLKPDKLIDSIDNVLVEIYNKDVSQNTNQLGPAVRTSAKGKIFLLALVLFCYLLLLLN